MKRATSRDVAALAGVSQSTVSLVLTGHPRARIAAKTRERVLAAARDLGYRPNLLARGLVKRRSFAIGVVAPSLDNPFFSGIVSGADRVASESGYGVLLCDAREVTAKVHLQRLRDRQVDGVLVAPSVAEDPDARALLDEMNVVVLDAPEGALPGVPSDAESAGTQAAQHLLGLGHRRLAFLGPASPAHTFRARERGFVRALREAGLTLPSEALRRVPATVRGGEEGMAGLLSGGFPPSAVFCANDLVAVGALKACAVSGLQVPDEISIVGCDDIELARYVSPELSTVRIPVREIGARAARLLLRAIEGEPGAHAPMPNPLSRPVAVHLVLRETTGPAPCHP
jgi:LacI family transcriptional regulator